MLPDLMTSTPYQSQSDPLATLATSALSPLDATAGPGTSLLGNLTGQAAAPASSPITADSTPPPTSHLARLQQILRIAVPALAVAYGLHKGTGLADFAQGWNQVGQQQDEARYRAQQAKELQQYRQDTLDRQAQDEQRLQARDAQLAEQARQAAEDRQAQRDAAAIDTAVGAVASHYNGLIPANVAERTSIDVPGLGRINLHAALQQNHYAADAEGNYYVGKAAPDRPVPYSFVDSAGNTVTQMVPSTDPRLTAPHITRRPAPRTPKEPKEPTVTFTDGLGKVQTLKRSQVRDLLRQNGYQNDDASVDRVMASPAAVAKLIGAGAP